MSRDKSQNPQKQRSSVTEFSDDPLKDKIGSSLRQMYDDVVNEPIPLDFLSLLAKADKTSPGTDNSGA